MSDAATPPPPAPADEPEKKKFRRANNDQRIAAEITAADRFLKTVGSEADIQPIALQHGIDAAELAAAADLVVAAARKWGVRLEGMGTEEDLVNETAAELQAIKDAYLSYREIGRGNFPTAAARTALGLSGDIPDGFNVLMAHIKAAYQNAKEAPYTAILTKRNYAPVRLDALIKEIDDLVAEETDQTEAEGDAMKKTQERDAAYTAMKDALRPIKGTLKGALRKQPALLAKLGL